MDSLYANYALVALSVIIFGFNFACTDKVRQYVGSGIGSAFFTTVIGSSFSAIFLFCLNGFRFEFTLISLGFALLQALVGILFTFCSYKSLDIINLSLYSLFSMLGGMVLPFILGIIFFDEPLTLAKAVCMIIIFAALAVVVKPKGKQTKKIAYLFYAGVFVLNGMSGVVTTLYKRIDGANVSSTGYQLLSAVTGALLAVILLPLFIKDIKGITKPLHAIGITIASGFSNKIANLILTVALTVLPSSVQYPMVTGGVIIVSTVIALFSKKKPTSREYISVVLAFAGILALVLIPM